MAWIGFCTVFSFGYLIYRLPLLRSRGELDSWVSREFAFLLNNWVLLGAALFILVATMFPTLSEAVTGTRVTVGPPFFNKWMAPIGLVLLLLTGVGPLIAWKKASRDMLWLQFRWPLLVGVLTALGIGLGIPASRARTAFMHDRLQLPVALICFGICGFVLTTIAQEFYRGARARQAATRLDLLTSLVGLVARNKRRYGGYLVHVGIVLMFIGFAGQAYEKESEVTLDKGQSTTLGRYKVQYEGYRTYSDAQKEVVEARLAIFEDGRAVGELHPAKWAYHGHEEEPPRTIVQIRESLRDDLYVILNGIDGESGLASIKVIVNPLVNWVWFGFVWLILGTALAFLPERAYELAARAGQAAALVLLLLGPTPAWADAPSDHSATVGSAFPTPPRNDLERELRKMIVCMCGCGRQTLADCTCGYAAKERAIIARMLDEGKTKEQVIDFFLKKYPGESALIVPMDTGFNRVAWLLPCTALVLGAGALVMVGRRWSRRSAEVRPAPEPAGHDIAESKRDEEYQRRLDDDLNELD